MKNGRLIVDRKELAAMENGLKRISNASRKKKKKQLINQLRKLADEIVDMGVDYIVIGSEAIYVAERKTLSDMMGSIYGSGGVGNPKNRLFAQLERVKEVAYGMEEETGIKAFPFFIAEGNVFNRYKARYARMTPEQWFGIQTKLREMEVGLIRTVGLSETVRLLAYWKKRSGKPITKAYAVNVTNKSLRTFEDELFGMLMNIRGLGEVKAKKLLEKYGSMETLVSLPQEALVKELGEKVGTHVYNLLHYNFNKQKKLI